MDYSELNTIFHPRSMAVIGASFDLAGTIHLSSMLNYGFQGKIYPINRGGHDVLGLKAYTSLKEAPDPIDFAFVQVPAKVSAQVIRDCAAKGVKLATLFTAGFGESENEWGKDLEKELIDAARQGGLRLLGPNCMGLYCPAAHLTFGPDFPAESGPVGILCQSGGNAHQLIYAGRQRGLRFSKVISYGNAIDINEAELMEYFSEDAETKLIIAYIEGVREGKRFYHALKKAARAKPVIVLKGGQTPAGAVATLSHTSSLAGSSEIWNSLIKQSGAILAQSVDECVDTAIALHFIKPPKGRKTVVIGFGGGATVILADDCYKAGLRFPPIPNEIKNELINAATIPGNIFKNPLDVLPLFHNNQLSNALKILGNWKEADILILNMVIEGSPVFTMGVQFFDPVLEAFIRTVKEIGKPAAVVLQAVYSQNCYPFLFKIRQACVDAGIPFYPSMHQAANALDKLIRYYEGQKESS